jgi:hypothetical protein
MGAPALRLQQLGQETPGRAGQPGTMKLFHLYRAEDLTGVSGTGPVVEGVEFTNGWCAIRWISARSSICFYQSIEDVRAIHGHGGRTELIVHDFEPLTPPTTPVANARMERFLTLFERISRVMNLLEDRNASLEELEAAFEEARELLEELWRSVRP